MKVCLVSYSDSNGGAARAAFRLAKALNTKSDVNVLMLCVVKEKGQSFVVSPFNRFQKLLFRLYKKMSTLLIEGFKQSNPILYSLNLFPTPMLSKINRSDADLVNLQWINFETISIKQISKINKPLVLTMHDMWAFSGAEHIPEEWERGDFLNGYKSKKITNLNRITWLRKKLSWRKPFQIVTPSNWMSNCVASSDLFKGWPVATIPNALDIEVFKPLHDKQLARTVLGLPKNKKVVGCGAWTGSSSYYKGFDLLEDALNRLHADGQLEDSIVVTCGGGALSMLDKKITVCHLEHLKDEASMCLFYNALDVMVVPSRVESFGQVASEAQSCGVPVVAFNATGLKDIVSHEHTGFLAAPYSSRDLANGIKFILKLDQDKYSEISEKSRERATDSWSYDVISQNYSRLYSSML